MYYVQIICSEGVCVWVVSSVGTRLVRTFFPGFSKDSPGIGAWTLPAAKKLGSKLPQECVAHQCC